MTRAACGSGWRRDPRSRRRSSGGPPTYCPTCGCDVGLVQVSPPDADGLCSLGVGVDYAADAVAHTPVLIAEVNRRMPATAGSARIPLSRFSAVVETDRPLLEAPPPPPAEAERALGRAEARPGLEAPRGRPDEAERAIGRHVAGLIEDGDTIQLGVGSLPSGVLQALTGHVDLGGDSGRRRGDVPGA